jgi:hypothetical protein
MDGVIGHLDMRFILLHSAHGGAICYSASPRLEMRLVPKAGRSFYLSLTQ